MPSTQSQSRNLLDAAALQSKIVELADGLAAFVDNPSAAALIGIQTRGATLARRLHAHFQQSRGWDIPIGALDITLYRDDLSQLAAHPLVRRTDLPFDIEDRTILLVDDVLYSGRTIRSALDELIDFGRPRAIRLGVLIDRGGREYPIQADVAPLKIEATPNQQIQLLLQETDGRDAVLLTESDDRV